MRTVTDKKLYLPDFRCIVWKRSYHALLALTLYLLGSCGERIMYEIERVVSKKAASQVEWNKLNTMEILRNINSQNGRANSASKL